METKELLTDPGAFVKRNDGRGGYGVEMALVAALGVLGAIGPLYYAHQMRLIVDDPADSFGNHLVGLVLVSFGMVFGVWVVYALVSHALARLSGGRGRLNRLFHLTAWALLPLGIGYLARSIALVVTFRSMASDELPTVIADAERGREVIVGFETGIGEPVAVVGAVVLAATILWSGYVLSFAVEHEYGIGRRRAIAIAMTPAVVYALYELFDALEEAGLIALG